jgi:hypothetical protein
MPMIHKTGKEGTIARNSIENTKEGEFVTYQENQDARSKVFDSIQKLLSKKNLSKAELVKLGNASLYLLVTSLPPGMKAERNFL